MAHRVGLRMSLAVLRSSSGGAGRHLVSLRGSNAAPSMIMPRIGIVAIYRPATRSYASMPTQEQISQTFATPFRQFITILSRIARIIVFTAVGAGSLACLTFEGVHLYVENVSMPREQIGAGIFDDPEREIEGADRWGWTHDFGEETWVGFNYKGTDPRLGFSGRHVLRAAWMSLKWGGGIDPGQYLSGGGIGAPTLAMVGSAGSGPAIVRNGLQFTERFLLNALTAAEGKGIRLPDMAAIRAGLQTPTSPHKIDHGIDKTAVMLEYQLAAVRELIGSPSSLRGALAGYVRLFDALSSVANTNHAMEAEGKQSGQSQISTDRLVRLATKIGDLHALTEGSRADGEEWLLQAVQIAGGTATHLKPTAEDETVAGRRHALKLAENAGLPSDVGGAVSAPAHSPSLTRSLITALFSLSGFYASDASNRKSLEHALQFQANALRLARVDMERMSLAKQEDSIGAQLHRIWIAHHDALACVHLGETMYGLHLLKTGSGSIGGLLSAVGLGGGGEKREALTHTLAWLDEAGTRAKSILLQLGDARGRRAGEPIPLTNRWQTAPLEMKVRAERLLRDTVRLREAVDDMKSILTKSTQK